MQTITVEVQNQNALQVLQDLQEKKQITILATPDFSSAVFPGEPLTTEEFKQLVIEAESAPATSLQEAKTSWAKQKEALRKIAR